MCCLIFSGRGLAYFGVLIQLIVALLIIPLITLLIAFTAGPSSGRGRYLSSSEIWFVALYCIGLCILGGIIFRGIRKDSLKSLYISISSLLIVQLIAGIITILSWRPATFSSNDKEVLIRVTCLALNAISTITYLCILICYTSHLRNKLHAEYEDEESDFYYQYQGHST